LQIGVFVFTGILQEDVAELSYYAAAEVSGLDEPQAQFGNMQW